MTPTIGAIPGSPEDPTLSTAVASQTSHREEMLHRLNHGDDYGFLALALPYLLNNGDDSFVHLMVVRSYLQLGLMTPAREQLTLLSRQPSAPPEVDQIHNSLDGLGDGRIPWSRQSEQFEANLAALKDRKSIAASIRREWSNKSDRYELFRDSHGVYQVRERNAAGHWNWLPILANHDQLDRTRPMPDGVKSLMPGPYLFEGLGLGGYFEGVYQETLNSFLGYGCALYVVEKNPARLAAILHLRNWKDILADERVFLFLGQDANQQLCQAWDDDFDLPWPKQAFTTGPFEDDVRPEAVKVVHRAGELRQRRIRASLSEIESQYSARTLAHWTARFEQAVNGSGNPLRILAVVSTHTTFLQHSMRDAIRALESLGHICRLLTERNPYTIVGPLTYHHAIREFDPDLFFVIDHLRPEFQNLVPTNLPILTWDQDQLPHVLTRANLSRIARHDFIVGCSKSRCIGMGVDPRQMLHARVPTCPEQFGGESLSPDELRRYSCDVSFVSHASQMPEAFYQQERAAHQQPELVRLLDEIYRLLPPMLQRHRVAGGYMTAEALREAQERCGIRVQDDDLSARLRNWTIWRLADRIFRHEALEWVAQWARRTERSFRIYGNGWEKHPTLAPFAAGPAQNGRELLCVYRASKINLQLMPAGFIHQRSVDGLAAGGFFLTRRVPFDFHGKTLRQLVTAIQEFGIHSTGDLLASPEPGIQSLLRDHLGEWLERGDHHTLDLLSNILLAAELSYPAEVFDDFGQIVFDSAEEFAAKAERFLGDEPARRQIAERMRAVVVERFSYRSEMRRFLRAMCAYLSAVCVEASSPLEKEKLSL